MTVWRRQWCLAFLLSGIVIPLIIDALLMHTVNSDSKSVHQQRADCIKNVVFSSEQWFVNSVLLKEHQSFKLSDPYEEKRSTEFMQLVLFQRIKNDPFKHQLQYVKTTELEQLMQKIIKQTTGPN